MIRGELKLSFGAVLLCSAGLLACADSRESSDNGVRSGHDAGGDPSWPADGRDDGGVLPSKPRGATDGGPQPPASQVTTGDPAGVTVSRDAGSQPGTDDGTQPGTDDGAPHGMDAGSDGGGPDAPPETPSRDDDASVGDDDDASVRECPPNAPAGPVQNLLILFDRSGSMESDWNGQVRWQAAGNAVSAALQPLTGDLDVGAIFFPSPTEAVDGGVPACVDPTGITCIYLPGLTVGTGTCEVHEISESDQIPFTSVSAFLSRMQAGNGSAPLNAPVQGGRTPLMEALQRADASLHPGGVALPGRSSVLIISDGAPNCAWDPVTAGEIVDRWRAAGIETHAIDLGDMPMVLDELAARGGTGAATSPLDVSALQRRLEQVVSPVVQPCRTGD